VRSGLVSRRPLLALLAALAVTVSAAGCVSLPGGGPVRSYSLTQGSGAQSQPYFQFYPQPPVNGWTPEQVVTGFLTASASFANGQQLAREYLAPGASSKWKPNWSATVFKNEPTVKGPAYPVTGRQKTATVTVTGSVQATLSGSGSYAVPSAKAPGEPTIFHLVKANGQWRISAPPQNLLLTVDLFDNDYQLRNLYFFDPNTRFLVPDPVYVPLQATPVNLMNGLVRDLIKPPQDWLFGATRTAFPVGTTLASDIQLVGGTATVNLGGTIAKPANWVVLQRVSAQLLWTLSGSVELFLNGKSWNPPGSQENPVQNLNQSQYRPPTGASNVCYYLDGAGNLWSRDGTQGEPVKAMTHIGAGFTQIAVSPSVGGSRYLAALRGQSLFIGPVGGKLAKRAGSGYTGMSWDSAGNLWATTSDQIWMLRGAASPGQPPGEPVAVDVYSAGYLDVGLFTALRVAPDGVRVALIVGSDILNFGAIVSQAGARAGQAAVKIELSPFSVSETSGNTFSAVTWYGPDNVITLGAPGAALTEYPVDGGSSTSIPSESYIQSITASWGSPLVAGLRKDQMAADPSLTGSWMPVKGTGISPVYPG
jgi:hypothetical protein